MMNITINENAISMNTVNDERIYLPYNGNKDELYLEAAIAVLENREQNGETPIDLLDCSHMIDNLTTCIIPHVSGISPTIGFKLDISTKDGQHIEKRIRVNAPAKQVTRIIDRFFKSGAKGLKNNIRDCFKKQHDNYCRRYAACTA